MLPYSASVDPAFSCADVDVVNVKRHAIAVAALRKNPFMIFLFCSFAAKIVKSFGFLSFPVDYSFSNNRR